MTFEVTDQGIGILPEDLRTLYQPFQRSSNVGKITGSGLGLAVVKRCVDLQQGQMRWTVQSALEQHLSSSYRKLIHNPIRV